MHKTIDTHLGLATHVCLAPPTRCAHNVDTPFKGVVTTPLVDAGSVATPTPMKSSIPHVYTPSVAVRCMLKGLAGHGLDVRLTQSTKPPPHYAHAPAVTCTHNAHTIHINTIGVQASPCIRCLREHCLHHWQANPSTVGAHAVNADKQPLSTHSTITRWLPAAAPAAAASAAVEAAFALLCVPPSL